MIPIATRHVFSRVPAKHWSARHLAGSPPTTRGAVAWPAHGDARLRPAIPPQPTAMRAAYRESRSDRARTTPIRASVLGLLGDLMGAVAGAQRGAFPRCAPASASGKSSRCEREAALGGDRMRRCALDGCEHASRADVVATERQEGGTARRDCGTGYDTWCCRIVPLHAPYAERARMAAALPPHLAAGSA